MSHDPIADLITSLERLSLSSERDEPGLPKRWRDNADEQSTGQSIRNFLLDWPDYHEYYNSMGVPCRRVGTNEDGTVSLQPRGYANT